MLSPAQLAAKLNLAAARIQPRLVEPTEQLMQFLETMAKGYIGEYQAGWAPLADSTLYGWDSPWGVHYPGKIELGYAPPDNPLLRTGEMQASIRHRAWSYSGGAQGEFGSDSKIALWQEGGTSRGIPPRPFIGLAVQHSQQPASLYFGEFAMALLSTM